MVVRSQSPLQPLVRKLLHRGELEAADEEALLNLPHRIKEIERHGFILRERDKSTHSCVMLSGFAIRYKVVEGGARQIVAIHMKGDVVNFQNCFGGVADHRVQVLTDSDVAFISREAVKKLICERPNVGMALWHDALVDASILAEWIANVGRRNAFARIAHFLCELSLRLEGAGLGERTDYELPMTQEQIADSTGLTPVHVNRMLKAMELRKLIARRNSRSIRIGDWRKLADVGDFDSSYLHLREEVCAGLNHQNQSHLVGAPPSH